jgi:hypothetical protein
MKKCYLVNYSHGRGKDYQISYLTTAFLSFDSAKKAKEKFEKGQKILEPFPIKGLEYSEFTAYPSNLTEDENILIDKWEQIKDFKESFNEAWIIKLELKD